MTRRCRYRPGEPDPYAADLVRRIHGLMALVAGPPVRGPCEVRREDELLHHVGRRNTVHQIADRWAYAVNVMRAGRKIYHVAGPSSASLGVDGQVGL